MSWNTPTEVASKFGISVSTLKRLCDKHKIPLHRTPGGHRRIDKAHIDALYGLLTIDKCHEVTPHERVSRVFEMLISGKDSELIEFLWGCSIDTNHLVDSLVDTLVPALWKIGDAWLKGEIEIAHEKVSTSTAIRAVDGIAARFHVNSDRPRLLGATMHGSSHTIANKLISLGFKVNGIHTLDLGDNVAPRDLATAVRTYNIQSIWISHTHVDDPKTVIELHEELRRELPVECRVNIGGGGLSPSLRRSLVNCCYFECISMFVAYESSRLD